MLLLIVLSLVLIPTVQAQPEAEAEAQILPLLEEVFEVTPFTNFSFKLDDVSGECKPIHGMKVSTDVSLYEGRWYALYYGFSKEQAKNTNCLYSDFYFKPNGHYHLELRLMLDGKKIHWRHKGIPVDAARGIYEWHDGRGKHKSKSYMMNTFFYIDNDLLAYWVLECLPGQGKHKEHLIIALRRLEDEEKKKDIIEEIYKEYEARGGKTLRLKAKQENCKYHHKRKKHPFKHHHHHDPPHNKI